MRLLIVLLFAACASTAQAAITIRGDSAVFGPGASTGVLDVFISSDTADDIVAGLIVDFELIDGGDFPEPPGVFGQTGFFGDGVLNTGGSGFERIGNGIANLSLDFETFTSPPTDEILLAQLSIDLTGLAPGVYQVAVTNPFILSGDATEIPTSVLNGSFEVTAIPEPATTALLGLGTFALYARRFRKLGEHSIV